MSGNIVIYAPFDVDLKRLEEIKRVVESEARSLDLRVKGPFLRSDNRICVFYEDEKARCYVYIDDYEEPLNIEKMALTIRLMSTITMMESGKIKVEVE
ncbi:MAG: hypothetical protein ACE5GD_10220 [Candidatus Geothermarchaeales archaeon]